MSISLQRSYASSRWWTIRTRCGYHASSAETLLSNNDVFHNCSFRSPLQDKRGQTNPTVVVISHSSLLGSQCAIGKQTLIHNIYTCSIVHRSSRSSIWNKKWARMGRFIQFCPTKSAKDNLQKTLYSANSKAPASRGSFALRGPRPTTRPCECPRYPSDLLPNPKPRQCGRSLKTKSVSVLMLRNHISQNVANHLRIDSLCQVLLIRANQNWEVLQIRIGC